MFPFTLIDIEFIRNGTFPFPFLFPLKMFAISLSFQRYINQSPNSPPTHDKIIPNFHKQVFEHILKGTKQGVCDGEREIPKKFKIDSVIVMNDI